MPFKSDKQRRWMYANEPEMAKRWSAKYKNRGGPLSYEDPILLNELKRKMQERVEQARREGINVTHNYLPRANYRAQYGKDAFRANPGSLGEWNAETEWRPVPGMKDFYDIKRQTINVPLTPSLTNAHTVGEEYAHAKESGKLDGVHLNRIMKTQKPKNSYAEEMRAKKAADEFIGGYHTPRSGDWVDFTRESYRNHYVPTWGTNNVTRAKAEKQGVKDEASYKNEGGMLKWWNALKDHKGESDMVKRNRLSGQYQRARNEGLVPEGMKFDEWIQTQEGQEASANTTGEAVQSVGETMEFLPILGDVRAMENAWDAIQKGDYTTAAVEVGFTALGYVPFAGIASKAGKSIRKMKHADKIGELRKLGFSADDALRAIDNPHVMDAMIGDALYSGRTTVDNLVDQGAIAKEYAEGAKQQMKDLRKFEEVTGVRPNFTDDGWSAQSMNTSPRADAPYGADAVALNVPAPLDARRQFVIDHELGHLQNPYGTASPATGNLNVLAEEEAANRFAVNRAAERGGPTRPDWYDPEVSENLNESFGSYLNNQEVMIDAADGSPSMTQRVPDFDEDGDFIGYDIYSAGDIPEGANSNVYDILEGKTGIAEATPETADALMEELSPATQELVAQTGDKFGQLRQTESLQPWDFMTGDQRYGQEAGQGYDRGGLWPDAEGNIGTAEAVTGGPREGVYKQPAALAARTEKGLTPQEQLKRMNIIRQSQGLEPLDKLPVKAPAVRAAQKQVSKAPLSKDMGVDNIKIGQSRKIESGPYAGMTYSNAKHPHSIEPQTFNADARAPLSNPIDKNLEPVTDLGVDKKGNKIKTPTKRLNKSDPVQTNYELALAKKFDSISRGDSHAFARAILDYPEIFPQNEFGAENFKRMKEAVAEGYGLEIGSPLKVGRNTKGTPGYNARVTFLGADGQEYTVPVSATNFNAGSPDQAPKFKLGNTRSGKAGKNLEEMDLGAPRFNKGGRVCGPLGKMKGGM